MGGGDEPVGQDHVDLLVEDRAGKFGVGRLVDVDGRSATVSYFDHPGEDGATTETMPVEALRREVLAPQTRVHTKQGDGWLHGRVLEHDTDFAAVVLRVQGGRTLELPEHEVVVRRRGRLHDATPLLANVWVESRRFFDARSAFVGHYLDRRNAYEGLTAICSSSIELHPHQLEAARRVLTDVSPRYLLADEVGLGKTIETGVLIRQHLLDDPRHSVSIVLPPALTSQWHEEMEQKFRLFEQFPGRCGICSFPEFEAADAAGTTLLVVDEAHRLAAADAGPHRETYEQVRVASSGETAVLLISATPLLQDEMSLLRLLHLLAPEVHRLDELESFKRALRSRDEIATYFANLRTDVQSVFLRDAIEGLRRTLPDDGTLVGILDELEDASGAEERERLVRRARGQLTEAHRIYSRMIRTRRGVGLAEEFPVLGRRSPDRRAVPDSLTAVREEFFAWHEFIRARMESVEDADERTAWAMAAFQVAGAVSAAFTGLEVAVSQRLADDGPYSPDPEERELLASLQAAASRRRERCGRLEAGVDLALEALRTGTRLVLAVGSESASERLAESIRETAGVQRVFQLTPENAGAARSFEAAEGGAVLVIGPVGEEGQNLQVADCVAHVDLPWSPNRLEQRLGRFDRFGGGLPATQVLLVDDEDSLGNAWVDLLHDGFGIFDGSVASLQLAIDRLMPRIRAAAVVEGAAGLREQRMVVRDALDEEIAAVETSELLDQTVLDERGRQFEDSVLSAEGGAHVKEWGEAVVRWAAGDESDAAHLRFFHESDGSRERFALTRFENPDPTRLEASDLPLVPWSELANRFAGAMKDGEALGSFRRLTASRAGIRLFGPGDPFAEALWSFTEEDDRGRVFAIWRSRSFWRHDRAIALCFELRVSPDTSFAEAHIQAEGARSALRRRAEAYMPATTHRVWLNVKGAEIKNEQLLQMLNTGYSERAGDQTLRQDMWHVLTDHLTNESWADLCARLRTRAEEVVVLRTELDSVSRVAAERVRVDSQDAVAQLAARPGKSGEAMASLEQQIGTALAVGIEAPRIEIDAAGIVVLAHEPLPTGDV